MTTINTGAVHHLALTVTDSERSRDFYVNLLGFQILAEFESTRILGNGSLVLAVKPAPDVTRAIKDDRFDENRVGLNRVGLDHLSLNVASLTDLDERSIPHGEIKELGDMGICVLAFRDPDNIQLELSFASKQLTGQITIVTGGGGFGREIVSALKKPIVPESKMTKNLTCVNLH